MNYELLTPEISTKKDLSCIEQVFANRGVEPSDIDHYLHTTPQDILNPELLDNLQKGAQLFISHLTAQDKIFIQIDSDADGYTSAAVLINYANRIAPGRTQANISYRIHDGKEHGIIVDKIPSDVKLVVVPDAGSNDYEQHKELKEKGIDVLVIDHHEADKVSEDACVINNQLSNYPNKNLSGVGVVYKFCQYLDKLIDKNYADDFLDLVAVGMVADMMDLRNFETRELITLGTENIKNPFIDALVQSQSYSLKGEVTPFGISFYIAPYINAVIRVGSLEEKLLMFESMLEFKAYENIPSTKRGCAGQQETRVEQACRSCKNIKNRSNRMRDASLKVIEQSIEDNDLLAHPFIIVELTEPVEENMTGLAANQIMGKYQHPVLILNRHVEFDKETGEVTFDGWRGSGRNSTYSQLRNMREFLAETGLVEYAQGHASAFGVSVFKEQLEPLKRYIDEKLKDFDYFSNSYRVDFIWKANEIDQYTNDIVELGKLERFWGQGLSQPQVVIENVHISKDNLILMSPDKKPTLKITLPNGLTLIKFKSSQEEFDKLYLENGCVIVNVVGTCNLNEWNGIINPQIIVEEYEEINRLAYYF